MQLRPTKRFSTIDRSPSWEQRRARLSATGARHATVAVAIDCEYTRRLVLGALARRPWCRVVDAGAGDGDAEGEGAGAGEGEGEGAGAPRRPRR